VHWDKIDFAGDLIFVLPTNTAFALEAGLPLRIKPNDRLSIDTGVEVRGTFGSGKRADIRIPAIVNYNFSDRAFIAAESGVQFVNLGKNFDPLLSPGAYLSRYTARSAPHTRRTHSEKSSIESKFGTRVPG